ncbi:amidohydrolase family protein [Ligilactobacillus saerimneri]|uniref:amidohydrolase family protein n=1 Tax=Ligilactobacillus saerimneri TaxID=228229 RepID=UPI0024B9E3E4|nr:amidohydrolase family protein [Ligilactobacillus saerimneri]
MELNEYIDQLPLVDHHCHYLIKNVANRDERLARVSTEADDEYPLFDIKNRLAYWEFKAEAQKFGSPAIVPWANDAEYSAYNQRLFSHYHFKRLFIDVGFVPDDAILSLEQTAAMTQTEVAPILRLETTAEKIMTTSATFDEWWQKLQAAVKNAKQQGYVGFKSIAAYRFGLKLTDVSRADAQAAFTRWKNSGVTRLTSSTVISYLVWNLSPLITATKLPLQFHVGYGDADTDMYQGNPLLMRDFLNEWSHQGLKVVLLHCYPYHREAGYLASVFPNLYFDISLIDNLGPSAMERVLDEALELAPYSRFLFASDASTYGEMYAVAAHRFKRALTRHLTKLDFVPEDQLKNWAAQICYQTSERIYLEK